MPSEHPRCHVCGASLPGAGIEYVMGVSPNPYGETCSEECYEIYYTDPDSAKEKVKS